MLYKMMIIGCLCCDLLLVGCRTMPAPGSAVLVRPNDPQAAELLTPPPPKYYPIITTPFGDIGPFDTPIPQH